MKLREFLRQIESNMRCDGECACGGKLIPHPWWRRRWICERSHWWNRKRHAYLVVTRSIEVREVKHE